MITVIKPPDVIDDYTDPTIFLAGPIQGTWNWQEEVINYLKKSFNGNLYIASPRRDTTENIVYDEQVDWETFYLNKANVIVFWLAKETIHDCSRAYAQTTRAELFEWKVKYTIDGKKLVIGIEPGFTGEKYIRRRFKQDCHRIFIYNELSDVCKASLMQLILK